MDGMAFAVMCVGFAGHSLRTCVDVCSCIYVYGKLRAMFEAEGEHAGVTCCVAALRVSIRG